MESTITTTTTQQGISAAAGTGLGRRAVLVTAQASSDFNKEHNGVPTSAVSKAESEATSVGFPLWKRAFDVLVILLTAPVWAPVCLVVALVIRLGSKGPVLFRQDRVGQGGRVFVCFKFRTMHFNAPSIQHQDYVKNLIQSASPMIKLDAENDGRLIRGGSWIRATGLDELPQLLNIVRGDMSIVGPRPCIPYEYEMYKPWQRRRCDAPPGLTGLWQVSGKNRTSFSQMVNLDIEYARRMSLWLDLVILVRTPLTIIQQVLDLRASRRARKKTE